MRVNVNCEFPGRPRAVVSVVIPCRQDREQASLLVASLQESEEIGEFLIVEPQASDSTVFAQKADICGGGQSLSSRPLVRYLTAPLGRAWQMNAGAREATGSVFLFLHADSRVTAQGIRELCQAMEPPGSPAVAFRLRYRESGPALRFLERGGRILSAALGVGFGDQGLGLRRESFLEAGMFPDVPILEDWFLNRRLYRTCGLRFLKSECETSARRFLCHGVWSQLWQNIRILYRGTHGADLTELAQEYESGPDGGRGEEINGLRGVRISSGGDPGDDSGVDSDVRLSGGTSGQI